MRVRLCERLGKALARERQGRGIGRARERRRAHGAAQICVVPGLDPAVRQARVRKTLHGRGAQVRRADEPAVALIEAFDQGSLRLGARTLENGLVHAASPVNAA